MWSEQTTRWIQSTGLRLVKGTQQVSVELQPPVNQKKTDASKCTVIKTGAISLFQQRFVVILKETLSFLTHTLSSRDYINCDICLESQRTKVWVRFSPDFSVWWRGQVLCSSNQCVIHSYSTIYDESVMYGVATSHSSFHASGHTSLTLCGWNVFQSQDYKIKNLGKYMCEFVMCLISNIWSL